MTTSAQVPRAAWEIVCKQCNKCVASPDCVAFQRQDDRAVHFGLRRECFTETNDSGTLTLRCVDATAPFSFSKKAQDKVGKAARFPFVLHCPSCQTKVGSECNMDGWRQMEYLFDSKAIAVFVVADRMRLKNKPSAMMIELIERGLAPTVRYPKRGSSSEDGETDSNTSSSEGDLNGSSSHLGESPQYGQRKTREPVETANPLVLPTVEMLREYFSSATIHGNLSTLRDYQVELVIDGLLQNTIVYLPTGCGKTLVAVTLMRILKELNPTRKAVFIVPTVPLVTQQASYLQRESRLEVLKLHSKSKHALNPAYRREYLKSADALVVTAQYFYNLLFDGELLLDQICLLVFDEAHHATGESPYCDIMKFVGSQALARRPRVLALTASPFGEKAKASHDNAALHTLRLVFDAALNTPTIASEALELQSVFKKVEWLPADTCPVAISLELGLREHLTRIWMLVPSHDIELFPDGAAIRVGDFGVQSDDLEEIYVVQSKLRKMFDKLEARATAAAAGDIVHTSEHQQRSSVASNLLGHLRCILPVLHQLRICGARVIAEELSAFFQHVQQSNAALFSLVQASFQRHLAGRIRDAMAAPRDDPNMDIDVAAKVRQVAAIIEASNFDKESRAIVFVRRRKTAVDLAKAMEGVPTLRDLHPTRFIGHNSYLGMSWEDEQRPTLDKFRRGMIRLLVATSVLEEGLDVPECSLVIRFDGVTGMTSLVQSRGRVRQSTGRFIVLCAPHRQLNLQQLILNELAMFDIARHSASSLKTKIATQEMLQVVKDNGMLHRPVVKHVRASAAATKRSKPFDMAGYERKFCILLGSMASQRRRLETKELTAALEAIREVEDVSVTVVEAKLGLVVLEPADGADLDDKDHIALYERLCALARFQLALDSGESQFWMQLLSKSSPLPEKAASKLCESLAIQCTYFATGKFERPGVFKQLGSVDVTGSVAQVKAFPKTLIVEVPKGCNFEFALCAAHDGIVYLEHHSATSWTLFMTLHQAPKVWSGARACPDFHLQPLSFAITMKSVSVEDIRNLRAILVSQGVEVRDTKVGFQRGARDEARDDVGEVSSQVAYALLCFHSTCCYAIGASIPSPILESVRNLGSDELRVHALVHFEPRTATVEELINEFLGYIQAEWPVLRDLALLPRQVVLKAVVTPTRVIFERPESAPSNRVFRKYDPDQFIYVYFRDENQDRLDFSDDRLTDRVRQIMKKGVKINGVHFQFLGCSLSQMRNACCVLTAIDPALVRAWIGDLAEIRAPAKYLKRLGQVFSSTRESITVHQDVLTTPVKDIVGGSKEYIFTDGCGEITPATAEAVRRALQLKVVPSAFQIRLAGAKGVLALSQFQDDEQEDGDNDSRPHRGVRLRESMVKFSSPHAKLEIVSVATPHSTAYLTRQSILILSDLGVPSEVFLHLQDEYIAQLAIMVVSDKVAFDELRAALPSETAWWTTLLYGQGRAERSGSMDAYHRHIIHAIYQYKLINTVLRARIPVQKGRSLMGVADFTGTLEYGEVFVQYSERSSDDASLERLVCLSDVDVLVHRSPSHHPGDLRVLRCRGADQVPLALRSLRDCIVFPTKGPRPHPDECTGGDLDGDVYTVIWDERLLPARDRVVEAMTPTEISDSTDETVAPRDGPLEVPELIDFYLTTLRNDILGIASIAHIAACDQDETHGCFGANSLVLAELCSLEVDHVNNAKHLEIVRELAPKAYPDFLQKPDKPSYASKKVLGKMYRRALAIMTSTIPPEVTASSMNDSMLVDGFLDYKASAELMYRQYKHSMRLLLHMSGAVSEAELATGLVVEPKGEYKADYFRFGERCRDSFYSLQKLFYDQFVTVYGDQPAKVKCRVAAAWYHAAYTDPDNERLLSFPWILAKHLIENKASNERDNMTPTKSKHLDVEEVQSAVLESTVSQLQLSLMSELDETHEGLLHDCFERLHAVTTLQVKLEPHFGARDVPIVLFGSSMLLTFEDQSDLDVFIVGVETLDKLKELKHYVTSLDDEKSVVLTDNTHVPVLAFSLDDKWAIEVSMACGGPLKTAWFRAYISRYPFFWPAAYFLMKWGKAAGLIRRKGLDGPSSSMLIPVGFLWFFLEFCIQKGFVEKLEPPTDFVKPLDAEEEMAHWRDLLHGFQAVPEPSPARVMLAFFQHYGNLSTPLDEYAFNDPIDEQNCTELTPENVEVFRERCYVAFHQLIVSEGDLVSLLRHQQDHRRRITLSRAFSKHVHNSPEFFAAKILREAGVAVSESNISFMKHPNALRPDLYVADVVGDGEAVHRIADKIERIEAELRGGNPRRTSRSYHRTGCCLLLFEGADDQNERVAFQDYMGARHSQHEQHQLHQAHLTCFRNGSRWLDHAKAAFATKFMKQMVKLSHYEKLNQLHDSAKAIVRFGHHYLIHLPFSFHEETITLATIDMLEQELERGRDSRELYESVLVARREARQDEEPDCEFEIDDHGEAEEATSSGQSSAKGRGGGGGDGRDVAQDKDKKHSASTMRRKGKPLSLLKVSDPRSKDRGVAHSFASLIEEPLKHYLTDFAVGHKQMAAVHTSDSYQVSIVWDSLEFSVRLSSALELQKVRTRPCRWFSATLKMRQEQTEDKHMDCTPDVRFYVSSSESVLPSDKLVRRLERACKKAPNGAGVLEFVPDHSSDVPPIRVSPYLIKQGVKLSDVVTVRHIRATTYQASDDGSKLRVQHVAEYEKPDEDKGFLRTTAKTEVEIVMPPLTHDVRVNTEYATQFLLAGVDFVEYLRDKVKLARM